MNVRSKLSYLVLALLSPAVVGLPQGPAGVESGEMVMVCGGDGWYFPGAWASISGGSDESYVDAGRSILSNLAQSFSCDKDGCEVGCNPSPAVIVEDAAGDVIDLSAPFNPQYWNLGSEGGLYSLNLLLPSGAKISSFCTRCRD